MSAKPRKRVLVVEDDAALLEMVERMLSNDFEVVKASNGLGGLLVATGNERPDLIVTDIMMPKLDGLAMAKRIKQDERAAKIPIIFLTAKDTPQDVISGIQAGARSYVTKPFKSEELLKKVRRALGERR